MKDRLKWLPWLIVAGLAITVIAAIAGWWPVAVVAALVALDAALLEWYLRRSLPAAKARVRVQGIAATIEIVRDADAVPHIYAQNKLDGWFGLGYIHAQDRLWQMEYQRRFSQGRLSEVFGPASVPIDRLMRTIGVYRSAQQTWERSSEQEQAPVNAYIAGINAFLAGHGRSRLSPEWRMLRARPTQWTGPDVLAWIKMVAWTLGGTYETELLRLDLIKAVGVERAEQLLPNYPEDGPVTVPSRLPQGDYAEISALGEAARALLGLEGIGYDGVGSNSWVVSGAKTTTGKPLLACDPHLAASQPATWYLAHVIGGELDVIGATIPGLPGVIIGRNRSIAWGLTNLNPDVQDLFQERVDPTGRLAEYQGQWEPMQIIRETINVKGRPALQYEVRITRHGPLISDAINANNQARKTPQPIPEREPLAFRWTALDPDDTTLQSFQAINEASNWDEFKQALRGYVAPPINLVYADDSGHIGYYAVGRIPIRAGGDGSLPGEGWSGAHDWIGWVPFEDLPQAYDPPQQMIVTANNRPIGKDYPYFLGRDWQQHFRAERITKLLEAKPTLTGDDFAAIQGDTVSLFARELLPHLLPQIAPENAQEQQALDLLAAWDGNAAGASAATALFEAWSITLLRGLLTPDLDARLLRRYEFKFTFTSRFLINLFKEQTAAQQQNRLLPQHTQQTEVVNQSFREALAEMQAKLGQDLHAWRWDKLHTLVLPHPPFHASRLARRLFSRRRPSFGDWSTVNFGAFTMDGSYNHGLIAGYRQIIDLSSHDNSRFIQVGGQSGHVLSSRYDDYLDDWLSLKFRPMRRDRNAIVSARSSTLHLEP